ncbi:MAG TPA: cyanophycinase [Candidatus Thermoplasmatota archaeon]|nr:cyanophycinase [Candidatus Thermoplasmatota archaeon]
MTPDGERGNDRPPAPRGTLVAIGGNEDKEFGKAVLKRVTDLPEGGTATVEVIPTASSIPRTVADDYTKAFGKLGIKAVNILDIQGRDQADRKEFADRIRACDVVFFTGGDQLRLTSLLGGTKVARAIKDHYWSGGVVAGTSAGAAAMSATMISESKPEGAMRKGSVQMTPGLGLIKTCVIDTHFLDRGRLSRLLEVVTSNPGYIGLGVGEDTGIIIRDGERVEVIGTGVAVVVDGHHLRYTNISDIQIGEAIAAQNIIVHTLVQGHLYHLADQRLEIPATKRKEE